MIPVIPTGLYPALKRGESAAFEELTKVITPWLHKLIQKSIRDVEETQDLIQDTLLAVFENISLLRDKNHMIYWVKSIAYNKSMTRIRNLIRDRETFAGVFQESETTKGNVESPLSMLLRSENYSTLKKAFTKLSEKEKSLIKLYDLEGLSAREVAQKLNMEEGTVRVYVHRARKSLSLLLKKFQD